MTDDDKLKILQRLFTQAELAHLLHALERHRESGVYYGPQDVYASRQARLEALVAAAQRKAKT